MLELITILTAFIFFACTGSLFMCGWYVITRPGLVFGFWSAFWEAKKENGAYWFPKFIVSPVSGCITCFASLYGSFYFWVAGSVFLHFTNIHIMLRWPLLVVWVIYCITCAAINKLLIKKIL